MNILYVIAAIVILGVIVAVHEFGHYIAGRLTGMRILEYAIGMGPRLCGFEKSGIKYSLRLFPFGGFCAFAGEDDASEDSRAMRNQQVWKRFITVAAGPVMNFVLAFVMLVVFYTAYELYEPAPVIASLVEGSAAEMAGFAPGDVITMVENEPVSMDSAGQSRLIELIREADEGRTIAFEVDRNGETIELALTPEWNEEAGAYQIGVMLGTVPVRLSFGEAVRYSGFMMAEMSTAMVDVWRQLFTNKEVLESTMGPVGIITTVSRDVSQGMHMVINWIVVISLNLGIMNLLPVPGLDGGRLLFLIVEGVRRKPIPVEKEAWVHAAGLILLLCFVAFITFKDVARLFIGG